MRSEKKLTNQAKLDLDRIRGLLPFIWPKNNLNHRVRVVVAFSLLVFSKALNVCVPLFFKQAVDSLNNPVHQMISIPVALILGYGLVYVLARSFNELKDAIFAHVSEHAIRQAAAKVFRHLHGLSLRFHMDRKTGGLSRVIERGTKAIDTVMTFSTFNILPTLVEICFVSLMFWFLFDISYMLVTISTLVLYIYYTIVITHWRTKLVRQMNVIDNDANSKAIDSLLNFETVKYFGNESLENNRYDDSLCHLEKAKVKSKSSLSVLNIGQGVIISISLMIMLYMGASDLVAQNITLGEFVVINSYLLQLFVPLGFLGFAYREIKLGLADMEQMFEMLDVAPEVSDIANAPALKTHEGHVAFDKVRFAYNQNRIILKEISFDVLPGKTVALVGESGAGKSTISRLLFRFYDVTEGAIKIDGHDIRHVTQDSLRRMIGIVPQDTVLFNDTIGYNIAYGKPGSLQSDIEAAAKVANIHHFIQRLPDGYDTMVGERGLKLSGGEKQRVAIARTILKKPQVFIFDEATSALDSKTEQAIQRSLNAVSKNHTTIIIAHRLSTIVHADEILVFQEGEIVERGRHHDLLAQHGLYESMWQKQQDQ